MSVGLLKLCPECGEEYVSTITHCVDCGVELGFDGPAPRPAATPDALPPTEQLVSVRHAEVTWIEALAYHLGEAGIPSRAEMQSEADERRVQGRGLGAIRCTLYVRPEDAEAAARIDAEFARTQVPDLPDGVDASFREAEGCPACGEPLGAEDEACGECGLVFASGEG